MGFVRSLLILGALGALAGPAWGQLRTVQGTVRDSVGGGPVPGAEVVVRGTGMRAVAKDNGEVTIAVPAGTVQLVVRAIGFRRYEFSLGPNVSTFEAKLSKDVFKMEEIVVTGAATGVQRANLANAVATVGQDDLVKHPTTSIETQLQGKVAGAEISTNSGAPGGGVQVRLRGITSINAAAQPLYVVDGVIASDVGIPSNANAITEAGGRSATNLNQDVVVNRISDLNPAEIESIEILKGASAAAIYGGRASNGVIIITTKKGRPGTSRINVSQRLGLSTKARTIGSRVFHDAAEVDGVYGAGAATRFGFQPGVIYDNEGELLSQRDLAFQTGIDVSGGTEATRYFASGAIENTPGIIINTYFQRQSFRINLDQRFNDKVNASLRTNLLHTKSDRGLTNNDNVGASYYIPLTSTPSFFDLRRRADGTFPVNPFSAANPLQTATLTKNQEDVWRFLSGATLNYSPISTSTSTLRLSATGGLDFFIQKNNLLSPPEIQFEPGDGQAGTSLLSNSDNLNLNLDANAVHTYTGKGLTATTSLGAQFARRSLDIARVESRGLVGGQSNIDAGTGIRVRENRSLVNTLGFFGQEEVLLMDDRLLLTAGIRADANSANADASKLYYYPKAAASYRLARAGSGFVNELKVRAAWGQSGNEPLYGQRFTPLNSTLNIGGVPGIVVGATVGNPNLKSERQKEIEFGIDGQLAGSRLNFEASVYQKNISDLLLTRSLPPSSGFAFEIFNGGKLRTRGVEFAIGVLPIQSRSTSWYTRGTFALYRSIVTSLPVPTFQTGGFGASLGTFQVEQGKSVTQVVGTKEGGGIEVLGDVTPEYKVSFINDFNWKRWGLRATLDWSQGGVAVNLTEALYDFGGVSPDFTTDGLARVTTFLAGSPRGWVESATYVKLRELALSYDLPAKAVSWLWNARSARLNLSGRNLFYSYPYKGLDPEVSNFGNQAIARGIDVTPYPPSRNFYFTIDIGF